MKEEFEVPVDDSYCVYIVTLNQEIVGYRTSWSAALRAVMKLQKQLNMKEMIQPSVAVEWKEQSEQKFQYKRWVMTEQHKNFISMYDTVVNSVEIHRAAYIK
jgi:hypothetical protein